MTNATVSPAEVARFNSLARRWWDPDGPMRPLHRMNPARIGWITGRIAVVLGAEARPRVLDVGCGAGLAAEALAREGFDVMGIDAAPAVIAAAVAHAQGAALRLRYRVATTDDLLAEGETFPVITALEVIEHVADLDAFVAGLRGLLAPGGLLFLSTLNRTKRSWVTAKLGAEYVLRWLPVGTHDWNRFLTPAEMAGLLRDAGLRVSETAGLSMNPLNGAWSVGRDLSVNYLMMARG